VLRTAVANKASWICKDFVPLTRTGIRSQIKVVCNGVGVTSWLDMNYVTASHFLLLYTLDFEK